MMARFANRSKRRCKRGSAILEFALASTVLFMLVAGLADLTRMFYYARIVTNSARAGIQYGMYSQTHQTDTAGMETYALAGAGNPGGLTAKASYYCQCGGIEGTVSCGSSCGRNSSPSSSPKMYDSVTTSFPLAGVLVWPMLPDSFTISYTATMRVQ